MEKSFSTRRVPKSITAATTLAPLTGCRVEGSSGLRFPDVSKEGKERSRGSRLSLRCGPLVVLILCVSPVLLLLLVLKSVAVPRQGPEAVLGISRMIGK